MFHTPSSGTPKHGKLQQGPRRAYSGAGLRPERRHARACGKEYGTNDTPSTELKRAASPGRDSTTEPKRSKPTPAGPEKTPTGPPNPTLQAATEVVASPNLTPPGPKINPRAPPGGLLAIEFMANLQKTVDTMARAACARSSKDSVFTETVREQIKEVGKTAGRIYMTIWSG
jgi:hypothetical protein